MTNTRFSPFGATLRRMLEKQGRQQKDLAPVLGISDSMLSAVMHGKRTVNLKWARLLGDHLELSPEDKEQLVDSARGSKHYSDIYEPRNEVFRNAALQYSSNVEHFFSICQDVLKSSRLAHDENQSEVVVCADVKAFQEFRELLRKLK